MLKIPIKESKPNLFAEIVGFFVSMLIFFTMLNLIAYYLSKGFEKGAIISAVFLVLILISYVVKRTYKHSVW